MKPGSRPTAKFWDQIALLAVMVLVLALFISTTLASLYQRYQLEKRYRDGPWTSALVREVWFSGSPKGRRDIRRYEAKVEFQNVIDGAIRSCVGMVNIGGQGSMKPGDRLRIVPLENTCGDIATEFD